MLKYKEAQMHIYKPLEAEILVDSSACTVEVTDVPTDIKKDVLWMILENKRYGGGELEHIKFCNDNTRALVIFKDARGDFHCCTL